MKLNFIFTHLVTYLDLPLTTSLVVLNFVTHVYLSRLTLDCQSKQSSIHSVRSINLISLIFFKSIFSIFIFSLSLSLRMLSPTLLSAFHLFITFLLPDLISFPFFSFSIFSLSSFLILTNAKCKCHAPSHVDGCHDRSYQCNMWSLCPGMPLIDSEPFT